MRCLEIVQAASGGLQGLHLPSKCFDRIATLPEKSLNLLRELVMS
jgi:hypothetical protein